MEITAIIISIISLIFTGITIIWAKLDRSNRILKYSICKFVYQYYAPVYMANNLPSSDDIYKKFRKMIEMVTDINSSFDQSKWKPNVIYISQKQNNNKYQNGNHINSYTVKE